MLVANPKQHAYGLTSLTLALEDLAEPTSEFESLDAKNRVGLLKIVASQGAF